MLAWEIARKWQSENCMTPFEEILGWHLSGGLVYSTREVFLLAQECHWTGEEMISRRDAAVTDAEHRPGQQTQDFPMNGWFVELAAASPTAHQSNSPIAEFLRVAPHPHKFVLWCRQSKGRKHDIHSYRWSHLARRVGLAR